jgi:hypothetical protein
MILNYQKGDDPKHVFLIPSFHARVRRGSADATKIMTDGNFLPGFHLFFLFVPCLVAQPQQRMGEINMDGPLHVACTEAHASFCC